MVYPKQLTGPIVQEIESLRQSGKSLRTIAKIIGLGLNSVWRALKTDCQRSKRTHPDNQHAQTKPFKQSTKNNQEPSKRTPNKNPIDGYKPEFIKTYFEEERNFTNNWGSQPYFTLVNHALSFVRTPDDKRGLNIDEAKQFVNGAIAKGYYVLVGKSRNGEQLYTVV